MELTRYIHLNPLRAGVVHNMAALAKYPWAGHSVVLGQVKRGWQDTDTILAYFGGRKKRARLGYEGFVRERIPLGRRQRRVSKGRRLFCQLAVKRLGYSGASVARFLGVTTSLVNRYASSEEVGNLDQYI